MGRFAIALAVGLVVHLLLAAVAKDDSDPPVCHSLIGYVVPCGNLSYVAGAGAAGSVAVLLLRPTAHGRDAADEPGGATVDTGG